MIEGGAYLAEAHLMVHLSSHVLYIIVHHRQCYAHTQDGHHRECDRRVGDELVRFNARVDLEHRADEFCKSRNAHSSTHN